jgi:hypothetical protein
MPVRVRVATCALFVFALLTMARVDAAPTTLTGKMSLYARGTAGGRPYDSIATCLRT